MPASRPVLVAAALAALTLAPAAGAGTACNLIVDPTGDQAHAARDVVGTRLVSPDTDVVGGDLATNRKYVTGVVRVASLRELDTDAPTGRSYQVLFTTTNGRYSLRATYGPDGYQGAVWDEATGTGIGNAGVVLDHAKREVSITASTATLGIVTGRPVTKIGVVTGHHYGTNAPRGVYAGVGPAIWFGGGGGMTQETDHATASRDYVAGSPSCVKVAR